jgi:hypothetical protein
VLWICKQVKTKGSRKINFGQFKQGLTMIGTQTDESVRACEHYCSNCVGKPAAKKFPFMEASDGYIRVLQAVCSSPGPEARGTVSPCNSCIGASVETSVTHAGGGIVRNCQQDDGCFAVHGRVQVPFQRGRHRQRLARRWPRGSPNGIERPRGKMSLCGGRVLVWEKGCTNEHGHLNLIVRIPRRAVTEADESTHERMIREFGAGTGTHSLVWLHHPCRCWNSFDDRQAWMLMPQSHKRPDMVI